MTNKIEGSKLIETIKVNDSHAIIVSYRGNVGLSHIIGVEQFVHIRGGDNNNEDFLHLTITQAKELAKILPEFIKKIEEETK